MEKRLIYFNEKLHRYTDDLDNVYTSVTTLIDEYSEKFNTLEMAKACARAGKGRYKNMNYRQIIKLWEKENKAAVGEGNKEHEYLEDTIKSCNGYKKLEGKYINDRLYTVDEVQHNNELGVLNIDKLNILNLQYTRGRIYNFLCKAYDMGYRMYPELGVYNYGALLSGLMDLPLINWDKGTFIIGDWKTNKHELIPNGDNALKYKSGYFRKDSKGNATTEYIETNKYFRYPLDTLQPSNWNKYNIQLSLYAKLVELLTGLVCEGLILFHIRKHMYKLGDEAIEFNPTWINTNAIDVHPMPYLTNEVGMLIEHKMQNTERNLQLNLL